MQDTSTAVGGSVAADPGRPAYVHTLSLRLTDTDYRRLRRFATTQEERLGRRLTHQAVLEAALYQFLERHAGTETH